MFLHLLLSRLGSRCKLCPSKINLATVPPWHLHKAEHHVRTVRYGGDMSHRSGNSIRHRHAAFAHMWSMLFMLFKHPRDTSAGASCCCKHIATVPQAQHSVSPVMACSVLLFQPRSLQPGSLSPLQLCDALVAVTNTNWHKDLPWAE